MLIANTSANNFTDKRMCFMSSLEILLWPLLTSNTSYITEQFFSSPLFRRELHREVAMNTMARTSSDGLCRESERLPHLI